MGVFLLYQGLRFMAEGAERSDSLAFRFREFFGTPQQAATALLAVGLLLGFAKGRFVLSKTVAKTVSRLRALPGPIRWKDAYPPTYWFLIGSMIAIGFALRLFPIDVRGWVDVAIGSALIQGALLYFRAAV